MLIKSKGKEDSKIIVLSSTPLKTEYTDAFYNMVYFDHVINWRPHNKNAPNYIGMLASRIKKIREHILFSQPELVICLGEIATNVLSKTLWIRNKKPFYIKGKWKNMQFNILITEELK